MIFFKNLSKIQSFSINTRFIVFINSSKNSLPASVRFCHFLIVFAKCLDPDQDLQNVPPDVDPNSYGTKALIFFLFFFLLHRKRAIRILPICEIWHYILDCVYRVQEH